MSQRRLEVEVPREILDRLAEQGWKGLFLDAEGRWFYGGEQVTHERLVAFLDRSIRPTVEGGWAVQAGREVVPVEVEDTAYFVRGLEEGPDGAFVLLSDGTREPLDPASLEYRGPGRLYCRVKGGRARARFVRRVYNEVVTRLEERDGEYVVPIGGHLVSLREPESGEE